MTQEARQRTQVAVQKLADGPIEIIEGQCTTWHFRTHFHSGNEMVEMLRGRTRLRTETGQQLVEAGETVTVPAGVLHRFEPVDAGGWAFRSIFILAEAAQTSDASAAGNLRADVIRFLMSRESLHSGRDDMARRFSVSSGHLSRQFHKEVGTTLHNYHVLMSLQKAKALLKDNAGLADAAVECGFYDQAHLTREFVRTFGLTPGAFRKAWANPSTNYAPM